MQDLSTQSRYEALNCVTHHLACQCREALFAERESEYQRMTQWIVDLKQSSKGTILDLEGNPRYALIPLEVLHRPYSE